MADNVGYTPGTGATVAADDVGGVLYQRMKITTGADGVAGPDVVGRVNQPLDTDFGLLVRQISEDNAYTQTLLNDIVQVLRSVWQMGSAAGAPSLTIRNATAADLQTTATISGTAAVNVSQINAGAALTSTGALSPSNSASNALVVAQSQQYHMPFLPEHIYFNIQV